MDNLKNWKKLDKEDKSKVCKAINEEVVAGIKVAAKDTLHAARALLTPIAVVVDCFTLPF